MPQRITIIYYFDPVSQWCSFADLALDRIRERFAADCSFEWRLAAINGGEPMTSPPEAMAWMYRRSKFVSGIETNAGWRRPGDTSLYACMAVEALRLLGADADTLRRAYTKAIVYEGNPMGTFDLACDLMARVSGIDRTRLAAAMEQARARVMETTQEYRALPVSVIPCLLIRSDIGDTALLSGLFTYESFEAVIGEMLMAARKYAEFAAANPAP